MKFVIVFVALFAVAFAAPVQEVAEILRYESDVQPDGYKFGFETSDGTSRDEQGVLLNLGTDQEGISVTGSFTFIGDDGKPYTVKYLADENGFQPEGGHLPKA